MLCRVHCTFAATACVSCCMSWHWPSCQSLTESTTSPITVIAVSNTLCGTPVRLPVSAVQVYGDPEQHPQTESYWGNVNPIGERSCYDEGRCAHSGSSYCWPSWLLQNQETCARQGLPYFAWFSHCACVRMCVWTLYADHAALCHV